MKLFREIGLGPATFLVIGNMMGSGIFTTSGLIAGELGGSFWIIGVWVLGGSLALIGAACYSVLGIRIPKAGGEYAFLYPFYGQLTAFLSGWASLLIGFSGPIAAVALSLAHYSSPFLPLEVSANPWALKTVAATVLISLAVCLSLGLKFGARIQSLVSILNLGMVLGFSVLVLQRSRHNGNLQPVLTGSLSSVDFSSLGSAVVLVMFAYSGWNAAAYIAEEIHTPQRNIPNALIIGTLAVMVAYVLMNLAYFAAVPLPELEGKIPVAEITASQVFGRLGPSIVNVLVSIALLSSLTAMSIAGPRVYFAMSRDQLFPKWLSEVDEKKKVPLKSIWFQSAVALGFIGVGSLYQILLYSGFILLLFATLTVSVLFRIHAGAENSFTFRALYRLFPAIFVAINITVLISAAFSHPKEALAGLLTVALGLPVYGYYHKRKTINQKRI